MDWTTYETTSDPVDGAALHWYEVLMTPNSVPRVSERRAIYHIHTPWEEHPWSRDYMSSRSGGGAYADFIDQWSIEEKRKSGWYGLGRTGEGWDRLRVHRDKHHELEDAKEAARRLCISEAKLLAENIGCMAEKVQALVNQFDALSNEGRQ